MTATGKQFQNLHIAFDERDFAMVRQAFDGEGFSGKARIVAEYEAVIADYFGIAHALAVSNGTVAIELALRGLGLAAGQRVGVPPTAPIMTILPVLAVGCIPVFYDVMPDSFCPDLDDLRTLLAEGLDAVITVPMWGYPWDMEPLAHFCRANQIALIEDCAHSFGTRMNGRAFGTFGDAAAFSTHERKLVSTGEGGFCLTPHASVRDRMRQWQHHGASKDATGVERLGRAVGTNYKLAPLCAALGISQFAKLDQKIAARRATAAALRQHVMTVPGLTEMHRFPGAEINGYAMVFWHNGPHTRALTRQLAERGIQSDTIRYDYKPLYAEPAFTSYARPCLNAEHMIAHILTLPCHEGLTPADLATIGDTLRGVFAENPCVEPVQ
jgi:perosamine synthetase